MLVFQIDSGGYYSSGMAIVIADDAEHATLMANLKSRERAKESGNKDYDLTYHSMNAKVVTGVFGTPNVTHRHAHNRIQARVVALHEHGYPEMPAKGSGIKKTF